MFFVFLILLSAAQVAHTKGVENTVRAYAKCKTLKQVDGFPVEFNTVICVFCLFYFLSFFCIQIFLGI